MVLFEIHLFSQSKNDGILLTLYKYTYSISMQFGAANASDVIAIGLSAAELEPFHTPSAGAIS